VNTALQLQWDTSQIQALRNAGLERVLIRSLRMAGGDAIRAIRAAANRSVRFRKRMKAGAVSRGLLLRMPRSVRSLSDLEWRVDVSGKAVPLAAYPHRQGKRGVSVAVNKGARKVIPSAFVARMKSGHVGIFRRTTKARLPIEELFSSRISDVIQDSGATDAIFARGSQVFSASFSRLLPLELAKAGAK